ALGRGIARLLASPPTTATTTAASAGRLLPLRRVKAVHALATGRSARAAIHSTSTSRFNTAWTLATAGPLEAVLASALDTIGPPESLASEPLQRLAAMKAVGLGDGLVGATQMRVPIFAPRQLAEPRIAREIGRPAEALP